MKKQAFFRFWLIVCIIALTIPFASCDENIAPAETTANITETAEITNGPGTTIVPETTSAPETTIVPETTSVPETTPVYETTTLPETTSTPETTTAPETTSAPDTTSEPETTEPSHVHAWSFWTTTLNATCTANGKQERNCKCGEKETKQISALGHTEVIDEAVAATCTTQGKTEGKHCSVCNAVTVKQSSVKALGHTEVIDKAVASTCIVSGKTEGKHCSVCNIVLIEQTALNLVAHTYNNDKDENCNICGFVRDVSCKHARTVTLSAKVPTCTGAGLTEGKKCSDCGEILVKQDTINALGHTEVIDKAVAATCTKNGKSEGKHCSVCKAVIVAQEVVEATGHVYGEWTVTTPATCTIKGSEERVCTCGKKEWQFIDALGHSYGEWTVTKTATCTVTGRQERVCNNCSRKENQAIAALGHTESEWIIDKEPTCQIEGSQHTVCTVCHKTTSTKTIEKLSGEHTYEGGFCTICGKISPDFSFPSGYITSEPIEIETEYCILKIDEYVYVVDGVAEKVDIVCRALEEVTGLKFKNDTYGKDKVVIHVISTQNYRDPNYNISGESEIQFRENTQSLSREIQLAPRSLFIHESSNIIHELAHALHFSQTKWEHDIKFVEGFATYATHLTLQYLAEKHTYIQYSLQIQWDEFQENQIADEELYKQDIEYWFENIFVHILPHYHHGEDDYAIGFRLMWYLHDTYGDFTQWILHRENIESAPLNHSRFIELDDFFTEIKQIYGNDIFDNFYPWLKANESIFEFELSIQDPFDLTNIEHITMYPMFDSLDDFTETGKIAFDNLYIDIEEAKKYLTEYKGKCIQYMRFTTLDGNADITFYDKDGNILYEANTKGGIWVGEEVSYIKLNGQGMVRNLEIIGYANSLENGLGFHDIYSSASTAYTELRFIYDFEGTHIIIPSEVNGLPVKSIKNLYNGTLDQVTEFTVSEGIEEMFSNTFRYLPNLKELSLPSTLNVISGIWIGAQTIEIFYAGTKSDWDAIKKRADWDKSLTSYTIHCTDGDITKGS